MSRTPAIAASGVLALGALGFAWLRLAALPVVHVRMIAGFDRVARGEDGRLLLGPVPAAA